MKNIPENSLTIQITHQKISKLIPCQSEEYTSDFLKLGQKYLHFPLAGDPFSTKYISEWVMSKTINMIALSPAYMSHKYRTVIDIGLMMCFLTTNNTSADQQAKEYYLLHCQDLKKIAKGVQNFREYIKNNCFFVVTNT